MRKLVYYVGVSIDGYIAGPGGEVDFYPLPQDMIEWIATDYPETLPTHVRSQLGIADAPNKTFDTLVMGRGTYEPALELGVTSPYAHLKQYIVSSSLGPQEGVEMYAGDPLELVRSLKAEEGLDIYLCGGGHLAGTVLPEIDQLIIKTYPVVAGTGVPALTGPFTPTAFTPTDSRSFSNGATVTWYART